MRRFLFVLLALAALAVPTSAGAAACRTADSCKSLEHDSTANAVKTVDVDNAGTALVGGRGGRVELLYSGTSTDASGGAGVWVVDKAAFVPPAWCQNVMFTARIHAITIGPGANLLWAAVRYDSSGGIYTTSAGAERGMEATNVVAPAEHNGVVLTIGLDVPAFNSVYNGTSVISVPTLPFPKIGFSHNWATAPTSWTIRWAVYCSG